MSTKETTIQIVADAANIVGGITKLAAILGVHHQTFYQWRRVPPLRVLPLESATGGKLTRHMIRPDLYPEETALCGAGIPSPAA